MQTISDDLNALASGWIDDPNPWTYLGVGQFVVGAAYEDLTATYPVGAKLSCTDAAITKFFSVVACIVDGATHKTTITVTGGSDYTLSGGAITNPRYSYTATPQGFPAGFAHTPAYSGWTATPTMACWIVVEGRLMIYDFNIAGVGSGTARSITLPAPAARIAHGPITYCLDNSAAVNTTGNEARTAAASAALTFYKTNSATWINGNNCTVVGHVIVPI
jgi:hypothetical protein